MTNNPEIIQEIINKIHTIKKEDLDECIKDSLKRPEFTQLQCDNMSCKYNKPNDVEMGVITYCSKYKNNEEGCQNREWKELII